MFIYYHLLESAQNLLAGEGTCSNCSGTLGSSRVISVLSGSPLAKNGSPSDKTMFLHIRSHWQASSTQTLTVIVLFINLLFPYFRIFIFIAIIQFQFLFVHLQGRLLRGGGGLDLCHRIGWQNSGAA